MTRRPTVVVTGASGFVGPAVLRLLEGRADVVAGGRDLVDLTDAVAVRGLVVDTAPDAVIHLAVANQGSPTALMEAVNAEGTAHLAAACAALPGLRVVNASTDVLHDGTAAPYAEDATPSPLHDYGRTKALGEQALAEVCPTSVSVRSSLVWDPDRIDRATVGFRDRLAREGALSLWTDVLRQPVHADDLAAVLVALALDHRDVTGTINAGGAQVLSRHGFGVRLLRHFGVVDEDRVAAAISEDTAPPGVPTDLRLRTPTMERLGLSARGVDDILSGG